MAIDLATLGDREIVVFRKGVVVIVNGVPPASVPQERPPLTTVGGGLGMTNPATASPQPILHLRVVLTAWGASG